MNTEQTNNKPTAEEIEGVAREIHLAIETLRFKEFQKLYGNVEFYVLKWEEITDKERGLLLYAAEQQITHLSTLTKERDECKSELDIVDWILSGRPVFDGCKTRAEKIEVVINVAKLVDHLRTQLELEQSKMARCVGFIENKQDAWQCNCPARKIHSHYDDCGIKQSKQLLSSLPTTPNLVQRVKELEAELKLTSEIELENERLNKLLVNLANRFVNTTETIDDPLIGQLVTVTARYIGNTGYMGEPLNHKQNKGETTP